MLESTINARYTRKREALARASLSIFTHPGRGALSVRLIYVNVQNSRMDGEIVRL
jgi:hypothetical protein